MKSSMKVLLFLLLLPLVACNGPAERAGERLDAQVAEAREQVEGLEGKIKEYRQEIEEARKEMVDLKEQLQVARQELEQARQERQQILQQMEPPSNGRTAPVPSGQ